MKKSNQKIVLMAVITLFIAVGTLVGAGVLANYYGKDFSYTPSRTEYESDSQSDLSFETSSQPTVSENGESVSVPTSSQEDIPEEIYPEIETGIYFSGEDSIVVSFYEAGFIEGNINCSSITMEFSGQMIDNTLTATGTDSLNNTIEIVLTFNSNKIDASSRPTIRYEENVDYLNLEGVFIK